MSLQGKAIGAKSITSAYTTIGCEFSIGMVTNGALHLVASIKDAENFHHQMTKKLEILTRDMPEKKANKKFHNYSKSSAKIENQNRHKIILGI